MKFMAVADTDVGTHRKINQDSLLVRHLDTLSGEVLLCVVCDGLGGLSKGELASAAIVRAFSDWFDRELGEIASPPEPERITEQWESLLRDTNRTILSYGEMQDIRLGSTLSGILFFGDRFVLFHVGDSRVYHIDRRVRQLTEDQTLAALEVREGRLTREQALADWRRNVLTQCVGDSAFVEAQQIVGETKAGTYLLCSDGLYHETTEREMREALCPEPPVDRQTLRGGARLLIDRAKGRGETDNISAIVVRAWEESSEARGEKLWQRSGR